jgi:hypothetical protein
MRNALLFLLLVLTVWTGIEVMTKGMGGAFGGLFVQAHLASPEQGAETTPVGRATERVRDAYRRSEQRVDDQAP